MPEGETSAEQEGISKRGSMKRENCRAPAEEGNGEGEVGQYNHGKNPGEKGPKSVPTKTR